MTNDYKTKNRVRIFLTAHRMIFNAVVSGNYGMAADMSRRFGGICESWQNEKVNKRFKEKQCQRKSAKKK